MTFDLKIGFLVKNCIYRQLGMSRILKFQFYDFTMFFNFDFHFFVFLAVILVPELFKKLRETPGNNFHQVSSKSDKFRPRILGNFYHIFPAKNLEIMYPPYDLMLT